MPKYAKISKFSLTCPKMRQFRLLCERRALNGSIIDLSQNFNFEFARAFPVNQPRARTVKQKRSGEPLFSFFITSWPSHDCLFFSLAILANNQQVFSRLNHILLTAHFHDYFSGTFVKREENGAYIILPRPLKSRDWNWEHILVNKQSILVFISNNDLKVFF